MEREPTNCPEPSRERKILPEIAFTGQQPGEESVEIVHPPDEKETPSPGKQPQDL